MTCPELLAPAGNFECLKKAVFAGANAVYFGAKNFNARAKANNFGEELKSAVAFCHMYQVKAYLTLNTLIEIGDEDELINTIKNAVECGIDAFIVQDFGVLNILKNCFSGLEIHTSTQMAVNNYLGAIEAEKRGAKRVVLSRETNLEDIKLIKEKTNLEIEYFIQGALCVCFSGNCYLSSKMFGKSGNKGECLQPCRLPYKAILKGKVIKEGYLLSAKDNCLANRLKELIDAGVDSFKIEGRLRREAYVYAVTKTYRNIIDGNYKVTNDDIINIKKAFNRGDFVEGYLNGNGSIIDYNIQGHKGIKIGEVINFTRGNKFNIVVIKSKHKIEKGDTLKFIKGGIECGIITAMDISCMGDNYKITTTAKVASNSDVHLILDAKKEKDDISQVKKLPINFTLKANVGEELCLEYSYLNRTGRVIGKVAEKAVNAPLDYNTAKNQLSKLGDTYFELNNFNLITNGVFVNKKDLNNIRQQAIINLQESFEGNKKVDVNYDYVNLVKNCKSEQKSKRDFSIEIGESINSNCDFLVIKPKNYKLFNFSNITHKNAFLYIPSFLRNEDLELINNILNNNPNLGVYAENIGALGYDRKTILGEKLNIKNIFAIKELLDDKIVAIHITPEISDNSFNIIKNSTHLPVIKCSFNNFDLMTLVHCPIKTIYDNSCGNCKYCEGITFVMDNGKELKLQRYKIANCYFTLVEK